MPKFSDVVKKILARSAPRAEINAAIKSVIEAVDAGDPRIEDDRAPAKMEHQELLPSFMQGDSTRAGLFRGAGKSAAQTVTGLFNSEKINENLKPEGTAETVGGVGMDIATMFAPGMSALGKLGKVKSIAKLGKLEGLVGTLARIGTTGAEGVAQTAALGTLKGNDAKKITENSLEAGVMGSILRGLPEVGKGIGNTYLRSKLREAGTLVTPQEVEAALARLNEVKPKMAGSRSPIISRITPDNRVKSFDELIKDFDPNFNEATRNETEIAAKEHGLTSLKNLVRIIKEGTRGAEFPSATFNKLGNRNTTKLLSENFTPEFEASGRKLIDDLHKYANRTNPKLISKMRTKNVPMETNSLLVDTAGNPLKVTKMVKESTPSTQAVYVDPETGKFVTGVTKNTPFGKINTEDLLALTRHLQKGTPKSLSESKNVLFTPRGDPDKNAVKVLAELVASKSSKLADAMAKTDLEVDIFRAIKHIAEGNKSTENFIPFARGVSGLSHSNLPYAGSALLTATKPVNAFRQVNKNSNEFIKTLLPYLMKTLTPMPRQFNREQ